MCLIMSRIEGPDTGSSSYFTPLYLSIASKGRVAYETVTRHVMDPWVGVVVGF